MRASYIQASGSVYSPRNRHYLPLVATRATPASPVIAATRVTARPSSGNMTDRNFYKDFMSHSSNIQKATSTSTNFNRTETLSGNASVTQQTIKTDYDRRNTMNRTPSEDSRSSIAIDDITRGSVYSSPVKIPGLNKINEHSISCAVDCAQRRVLSALMSNGIDVSSPIKTEIITIFESLLKSIKDSPQGQESARNSTPSPVVVKTSKELNDEFSQVQQTLRINSSLLDIQVHKMEGDLMRLTSALKSGSVNSVEDHSKVDISGLRYENRNDYAQRSKSQSHKPEKGSYELSLVTDIQEDLRKILSEIKKIDDKTKQYEDLYNRKDVMFHSSVNTYRSDADEITLKDKDKDKDKEILNLRAQVGATEEKLKKVQDQVHPAPSPSAARDTKSGESSMLIEKLCMGISNFFSTMDKLSRAVGKKEDLSIQKFRQELDSQRNILISLIGTPAKKTVIAKSPAQIKLVKTGNDAEAAFASLKREKEKLEVLCKVQAGKIAEYENTIGQNNKKLKEKEQELKLLRETVSPKYVIAKAKGNPEKSKPANLTQLEKIKTLVNGILALYNKMQEGIALKIKSVSERVKKIDESNKGLTKLNKDKLNKVTAEMEKHKEKINELKHNIMVVSSNKANLSKELATLKEKCTKYEAERKDTTKKVVEESKEIETLKKKCEDLQTLNGKLNTKIDEIEKEKLAFKNTITKAEEENKKIKGRDIAKPGEVEKLKKMLETSKREHDLEMQQRNLVLIEYKTSNTSILSNMYEAVSQIKEELASILGTQENYKQFIAEFHDNMMKLGVSMKSKSLLAKAKIGELNAKLKMFNNKNQEMTSTINKKDKKSKDAKLALNSISQKAKNTVIDMKKFISIMRLFWEQYKQKFGEWVIKLKKQSRHVKITKANIESVSHKKEDQAYKEKLKRVIEQCIGKFKTRMVEAESNWKRKTSLLENKLSEFKIKHEKVMKNQQMLVKGMRISHASCARQLQETKELCEKLQSEKEATLKILIASTKSKANNESDLIQVAQTVSKSMEDQRKVMEHYKKDQASIKTAIASKVKEITTKIQISVEKEISKNNTKINGLKIKVANISEIVKKKKKKGEESSKKHEYEDTSMISYSATKNELDRCKEMLVKILNTYGGEDITPKNSSESMKEICERVRNYIKETTEKLNSLQTNFECLEEMNTNLILEYNVKYIKVHEAVKKMVDFPQRFFKTINQIMERVNNCHIKIKTLMESSGTKLRGKFTTISRNSSGDMSEDHKEFDADLIKRLQFALINASKDMDNLIAKHTASEAENEATIKKLKDEKQERSKLIFNLTKEMRTILESGNVTINEKNKDKPEELLKQIADIISFESFEQSVSIKHVNTDGPTEPDKSGNPPIVEIEPAELQPSLRKSVNKSYEAETRIRTLQQEIQRLNEQISSYQRKVVELEQCKTQLKVVEMKYKEKEAAMNELSTAYIAKMEKINAGKNEILSRIEEIKGEFTVLLSNLPFGTQEKRLFKISVLLNVSQKEFDAAQKFRGALPGQVKKTEVK